MAFKCQKWRLTFMKFWHLKCQIVAFILLKLAFRMPKKEAFKMPKKERFKGLCFGVLNAKVDI